MFVQTVVSFPSCLVPQKCNSFGRTLISLNRISRFFCFFLTEIVAHCLTMFNINRMLLQMQRLDSIMTYLQVCWIETDLLFFLTGMNIHTWKEASVH